ncbi:MAG: hypothetical protein ACLPSF_08120 [Methylocella sp.]
MSDVEHFCFSAFSSRESASETAADALRPKGIEKNGSRSEVSASLENALIQTQRLLVKKDIADVVY